MIYVPMPNHTSMERLNEVVATLLTWAVLNTFGGGLLIYVLVFVILWHVLTLIFWLYRTLRPYWTWYVEHDLSEIRQLDQLEAAHYGLIGVNILSLLVTLICRGIL